MRYIDDLTEIWRPGSGGVLGNHVSRSRSCLNTFFSLQVIPSSSLFSFSIPPPPSLPVTWPISEYRTGVQSCCCRQFRTLWSQSISRLYKSFLFLLFLKAFLFFPSRERLGLFWRTFAVLKKREKGRDLYGIQWTKYQLWGHLWTTNKQNRVYQPWFKGVTLIFLPKFLFVVGWISDA